MLRRQRELRVNVQRVIDGFLCAAAFSLAYLIRGNLPGWPALEWLVGLLGGEREILPFNEYRMAFLLVVPVSVVVLHFQGFYNRPALASRRQTLWQSFKASLIMPIALVMGLFIFRGDTSDVARSVPFLFGALVFVLLNIKEEIVARWMRSKVGMEQLRKNVLLVGAPEDVARLTEEIETHNERHLNIACSLDINTEAVDRMVELLHEESVNSVILCASHTYFGKVEEVIKACELEGVEVWLLADFVQTQISQTLLDDFQGRPTLVFRSTPESTWQAAVKRSIDLVGSAVLLTALFLPLLAVGLLVKFTSPGPIVFRQRRSGVNGKPFTMYKFRSMVSDAAQRRHELETFNEISGPAFKLTKDPRVTKLGRILRKYSIDELPQLVNVFRGEMSLVGPRPLPVDETKRFNDLAHRRRLSVKPGLTCLWQISGRSDLTDFNEWVRLDLEYIDNWSLWLDLRILIGTIPVVFRGAGAK